MGIIKNKKGVFFIAITMVVITLLMTSYTLHTKIEERKVIKKRIDTMNNFVNAIQTDIERKIFIAGFRSIFAMEDELIETGNYMLSVNASFQEMFFNGTLNSEEEPIMDGATFSDLQNDLQTIGEKININVTILNPKLSIAQVDPWGVQASLEIQFSIVDDSNLSSWNIPLITRSRIPLSYFDDPLYLLNTGGVITKKINQTNYTSFTPTTLLDHTQNQYYKASSKAPSFLNRLEGNLSAQNPYGIESMVYIPTLEVIGIPVTYEKSVVDYIYFSSSNPISCYISGMPSWFYLDTTTRASYNVSCGVVAE